tara:strand:+ start:1554 stop:2078 length:525 start_codon:yes stop_codon:yes gene_type:complete
MKKQSAKLNLYISIALKQELPTLTSIAAEAGVSKQAVDYVFRYHRYEFHKLRKQKVLAFSEKLAESFADKLKSQEKHEIKYITHLVEEARKQKSAGLPSPSKAMIIDALNRKNVNYKLNLCSGFLKKARKLTDTENMTARQIAACVGLPNFKEPSHELKRGGIPFKYVRNKKTT